MTWRPYSRRSAFIRHFLPDVERSYEIGDGLKIRASIKRHLYMVRASRREWDLNIARKLAALVPEDGVIYDVGANMGLYSLAFAANRTRQIHSFEPGAEALAALQQNIAINQLSNISVHQIVLSDHKGTCRFTIDNQSTTTSHISENDEAGAEMPCCDLDSYIRDNQLPLPHLIKLDIEGADKVVFAGMTELLARGTTLIFLEGGIREDDGRIWAIDHLKELGYSIYNLDRTAQLDSLTQEYMYLAVASPGSNL